MRNQAIRRILQIGLSASPRHRPAKAECGSRPWGGDTCTNGTRLHG